MQSESPIYYSVFQHPLKVLSGTFPADLIIGWLPKITSPLPRVIYANVYWKKTVKICSAWKNEKKLCKINWRIAVSMQNNMTVPSYRDLLSLYAIQSHLWQMKSHKREKEQDCLKGSLRITLHTSQNYILRSFI